MSLIPMVNVGISVFESFEKLRLIGRDRPKSLNVYICQQLKLHELTYPQHSTLTIKGIQLLAIGDMVVGVEKLRLPSL